MSDLFCSRHVFGFACIRQYKTSILVASHPQISICLHGRLPHRSVVVRVFSLLSSSQRSWECRCAGSLCFVKQLGAMARVSVWICVAVLATLTSFGEEVVAGRSLLQSATCPEPQLPDVNLPAYAGVWYQIGSTALLKSITEVNLACTTGRYSIIDSGANINHIRVRLDSYNTSSGETTALIGLATVTGRKLSLQFTGVPTPSDYRIIYLGGDAKDKYQTAMTYSCTPGSIQSINILSRKPSLSSDETVEGLIQKATSLGINLEANNQFVYTVQDPITCGRNID